jgi:hypothetical protein
VEDLLPDIVPIWMRAPESLLVCETADRTAEVGAMPGLAVEGLVDDVEQDVE